MRHKIAALGKYFFLSLVALLSIFPLYWMAISATNSSVEIIGGKLLPGFSLMKNFQNLLAQQDVFLAMKNSFQNAIALTILSLIICSIAGYAFEVYHTKSKDRLMSVLLLAMMVPFAATMIPLFKMFSSLNLLNSTVGFILPTLSTPFLIMLFRQNTRSFPSDIIEAARIDGLGELRIFIRMYIPTMASTYAAAMTIVFMNAWNSYLWPKVIMLSNDKATMPMMVANLISGYVIDYGVLMLGVLLATIPTIVIFFALQRYFANGLTGSIK